MNNNTTVLNYSGVYKVLSRKSNLAFSDESMKRIVVLSLLAGVTTDGRTTGVELDVTKSNIINRFHKSEKDFLQYVNFAYKCTETCNSQLLFQLACNDLKATLTQTQLMDVYDFLSDVVVADKRLSKGEESFFNNLINAFELDSLLAERVPSVHHRGAYRREF